jgi:hypothetical protein
MILAGILTLIVPGGSFTRVEEAGRVTILPGSYIPGAKPDYPIWRWIVAPLEVLGGPDGLSIITIVLFILLVGGAFAVLEKCGILNSVISKVVKTFGKRKYILLLVVSFFFMVIGAFFGIFEEVVPLIPLMGHPGWAGDEHSRNELGVFRRSHQPFHHWRCPKTCQSSLVFRLPVSHSHFPGHLCSSGNLPGLVCQTDRSQP